MATRAGGAHSGPSRNGSAGGDDYDGNDRNGGPFQEGLVFQVVSRLPKYVLCGNTESEVIEITNNTKDRVDRVGIDIPDELRAAVRLRNDPNEPPYMMPGDVVAKHLDVFSREPCRVKGTVTFYSGDHRYRHKLSTTVETAKRLIERDKNGIKISAIDFGSDTIDCGQRAECAITIENHNSEPRNVRITIERNFSNTFSVVGEDGNLAGRPFEIPDQAGAVITAYAYNRNVCRENVLFYFDFGDFSIGRFASIDVGNVAVADAIRITKEYAKAKRTVRNPKGKDRVLDGRRLKVASNTAYTPPEYYDVPEEMMRQYFDNQEYGKQVLVELCSRENYRQYYHYMLWFEEMAMKKDILQYDMENVPVEIHGELLRFYVPGLLDDRPSVMRNDRVHANIVGDRKKVLYRGYVHNVLRDAVEVSFHDDLLALSRSNRGMQLNIEFTVNRSVLKRMHQAVDDIMGLPRWRLLLQYEKNSAVAANDKAVDGARIRVQQGILRKLNDEQGAAVTHIANDASYGQPYIIFGPPGTGKTTTIIAAINAVRQHRASVDPYRARMGTDGIRILVCAPSNFAADVLLTRLAERNPKNEMFRYMSYQRNVDGMDQNFKELILSYSNHRNREFVFPDLDTFLSFNIVVCTCAMAGILKNLQVPRGHFDVVFVDEAGHAIEPELMAAFAWNLAANGQLIIAGDPQQLGPVVRSKTASGVGLEKSFLERLVGLPGSPYEKNPDMYRDIRTHYNDNYITKLTKCYRCHPDILKIPNDFLYDGELEACADPAMCNNLLTWDQLPNKRFPMLFVGVEGQEMREESCPSWCNLSEVSHVVETVKQLMFFKGMKPVDIGIITPYFKQSQKISRGLVAANREYRDILVGSCEKFQGQERRAIIMSTVRSTTNYMEASRNDSLGFLVNPKRFNVAITRAKALVVIIGNPNSLCRDMHWNALIQYCAANGSWKGPMPPPSSVTGGSSSSGGGGGGTNNNSSSSSSSSSTGAAAANAGGGVGRADEVSENLAAMMSRCVISGDEPDTGDDEDAQAVTGLELPWRNDV
jgi:helicase MOV-10